MARDLSRKQIKAIKAKAFERGLAKIKPIKPLTQKDFMGIKTNGDTLAQKLNKRIIIKSKPTLKFPALETSNKFFAQLGADRKLKMEHPDGKIKSVAPKARFEVVKINVPIGTKFQVRSSVDINKIAKQRGINPSTGKPFTKKPVKATIVPFAQVK